MTMEKHIEKQLEQSYNGQLNQLFQEWKASYPVEADAENKFCEDGLVIKNKDENSDYDINEEWEKSQRKIMFLVKDCPDSWGYDTRRLLTGYEKDENSLKASSETRNLKQKFFKNLAKMLYGLNFMTDDYKGQELNDELQNNDKLIEAFNEIPFAYIECKKMAGGKSCSAKALEQSMNRDKEFFVKEIDILKPNIIVCCDYDGTIFNQVVKEYFDGSTPNEDAKWEYDYVLDDGTDGGFRCKLYYYQEKGILLFNAYHPTARKGEWIFREVVLSPLRQFFDRYKTFDTICGKNTNW